jgi:hypothetical protein
LNLEIKMNGVEINLKNSQIQIEFVKNYLNSINDFKANLNFLKDTENSKIPEIVAQIYPQKNYPLYCKHILICLSQKTTQKTELGSKKTRFGKLIKTYQNFEEDILKLYLVGESWIDFDTDNVSKSDGEISYIYTEKLILPVFKTKEEILENLHQQDLPYGVWIWLIWL